MNSKPIPVDALIPSVKATRGPAAEDIFSLCGAIFVRLLQRDQTERPRFVLAPGKGAEWHAAVYLGDAPPKIADHYEHVALVKGTGLGREGGVSHFTATGPGGVAAVEALRDGLVQALRERIESDSSLCDRATAAPLPRSR
jgi:hypothetical protein